MKNLNKILDRLFFPIYDAEKHDFLLSKQALEELGLTDFLNFIKSCPDTHLYLLEYLPSLEEYLQNTRQLLNENSFTRYCNSIDQLIQQQQDNPNSPLVFFTKHELSSIESRHIWSNYVSAVDIANTAYEQDHEIKQQLITTLTEWNYAHPEIILEQCLDYLRNHTVISVYFSSASKKQLEKYELKNAHQSVTPSEAREKAEAIFARNISIKNNEEFAHMEEKIKQSFIHNKEARPRYGKCIFIHSAKDFEKNSDISLKYERRFYYGQSFLIIKNKFNSTFTHRDSFHIPQDATACTYHNLHLLLHQDEDLLKRLAKCALDNDLSLMDTRPDYIEAQLPAVNLLSEQVYQIHFFDQEIKEKRFKENATFLAEYKIKASYGKNIINDELVTDFFKAVMTNQHEQVKQYLEHFLYLNIIKNEKNLLALELAAGLGHADTLAVLLKPQLFTGSFIFSRALAFAIANKQDVVIPQLVKAGAKEAEAKAILKALNLPWQMNDLKTNENFNQFPYFWTSSTAVSMGKNDNTQSPSPETTPISPPN